MGDWCCYWLSQNVRNIINPDNVNFNETIKEKKDLGYLNLLRMSFKWWHQEVKKINQIRQVKELNIVLKRGFDILVMNNIYIATFLVLISIKDGGPAFVTRTNWKRWEAFQNGSFVPWLSMPIMNRTNRRNELMGYVQIKRWPRNKNWSW